jgi:hypothetical protein
MDRPIIYAIKHKMSGMVDDYDDFTDNPEAWIIQRNKDSKLDDFYSDDKPETLDDFHVDELNIEYYGANDTEAYKKAYEALMEYWEQFPDDIKEPLDKELKKVGL